MPRNTRVKKARIKVNMVKFHPLQSITGAVRFCELHPDQPLTLNDNARGRVRLLVSSQKIKIMGASAGFSNTPIDLEFTIHSRSDTKVAGIIITGDGLQGYSAGGSVFELKDVSGRTLVLRDKYTNPVRKTWKLYIAVKNAAGRIGIIDPAIENEN